MFISETSWRWFTEEILASERWVRIYHSFTSCGWFAHMIHPCNNLDHPGRVARCNVGRESLNFLFCLLTVCWMLKLPSQSFSERQLDIIVSLWCSLSSIHQRTQNTAFKASFPVKIRPELKNCPRSNSWMSLVHLGLIYSQLHRIKKKPVREIGDSVKGIIVCNAFVMRWKWFLACLVFIFEETRCAIRKSEARKYPRESFRK